MKELDLTQGKPLKLLLRVALPLMLGNVFQQLYTVVDAMIVGSKEGVTALAALGAADWFVWLFFGLIQGLTQGFAIPMAQAFGAKDYTKLRRSIAHSTMLSAFFSVFLAVFAICITPIGLRLLNTPDKVMPLATTYMVIIFIGLPALTGFNLLSAVLRSLGDGKTPLYAMVIASLSNIFLDWLFVFPLGLGVGGAAAATVIAQLISCLYCYLRIRTAPYARFGLADMKPEWKTDAALLRLGIPTGAQNVIIAIGGMLLQSIINQQGMTFIAGFTATNKLYGVLEIAAVSYGYAITSYVGQNIGAKRPERVRSGVLSGTVLGVLTSLLIMALMFAGGKWILTCFLSGTPEEIQASLAIGWEYLVVMASFLPVLYILYVYRSALYGLGNAVLPMLSGGVEFVMRVSSALILPGLIGYKGIFYAEISAWAGAAIMLFISYVCLMRRFSQKYAGKAGNNLQTDA